MNNFTKEELEDLLFCVKEHTGYEEDSIHKNLIAKLQPMIDNYCKHEPKTSFSIGDKMRLYPKYTCTKCTKEFFKDE